MNEPIDIEVVIDEEYIDLKVMILTKEKTQQVESIICAIENVPDSGFSLIPATSEDNKKLEFISQRDIVRIFTEGRKLMLQTDVQTYVCKSSLSGIEEVLNPVRFIRISQSEIINIYKVKRFDISIAGTIGVEFENGTKTWASRSCVKQIKNILKNR
ncbi:MAG: LytTR family transcriptional regulator DNA-binding domain-containing protein [Lachnospiraceae bacterium]|nr:LytTR family transcriptional regulator DNA-binding domain-containing protein [Lachnospiraceae bacterium]